MRSLRGSQEALGWGKSPTSKPHLEAQFVLQLLQPGAGGSGEHPAGLCCRAGLGGAEQQARGSCCTVLLAGIRSLQAAAEREETEAFLDLNVWMTRVLLAQAHLPPMNI